MSQMSLRPEQFSYYQKKLLKAAYCYCAAINRAHYENFPVASILMPSRLRPAVHAIYAFSRVADDFADEAEFEGRRMEFLNQWESQLTQETPLHPVFLALKDARQKHDLPLGLFVDLLHAFKQDVIKNRYANFAELLDYCRYSANPVGRLVLHLFEEASDENLAASDKICTALQLTNFWQDVAVDLEKDRIYLPQEDLRNFSITEDELFSGNLSEKFTSLMHFEMDRTRKIFLEGAVLGMKLKGRLGVEIRLTWLTGMTVLKKIRHVIFDVFQKRPELHKGDFIRLLPDAFCKKRFAKAVQSCEEDKY